MLCFLRRKFRRKRHARVFVTYLPKGTAIMTNPTSIQVPAASTGMVARVTYELDLLGGGKQPTDAAEQITFATGGLITATVNQDGTVDYQATGETGTDTATVADDNETVTSSLVVTASIATGIEVENVQYVAAPAATAAAGTATAAAGTGTVAGAAS